MSIQGIIWREKKKKSVSHLDCPQAWAVLHTSQGKQFRIRCTRKILYIMKQLNLNSSDFHSIHIIQYKGNNHQNAVIIPVKMSVNMLHLCCIHLGEWRDKGITKREANSDLIKNKCYYLFQNFMLITVWMMKSITITMLGLAFSLMHFDK